MTIRNKLDYEINMFLSLSAKDPGIVIMSPDDWINLVDELEDTYIKERLKKNLNYRNIKIFRSVDIEQGNFIIK